MRTGEYIGHAAIVIDARVRGVNGCSRFDCQIEAGGILPVQIKICGFKIRSYPLWLRLDCVLVVGICLLKLARGLVELGACKPPSYLIDARDSLRLPLCFSLAPAQNPGRVEIIFHQSAPCLRVIWIKAHSLLELFPCFHSQRQTALAVCLAARHTPKPQMILRVPWLDLHRCPGVSDGVFKISQLVITTGK